MKPSQLDKAVFVPAVDGVQGFIIIHVDDLLFFGSEKFLQQVIKPFKETFKISKEEKEVFKYVGIKITQKGATIRMDQNQYLSNLQGDLLMEEKKKDKDRYVRKEGVYG